MQDNFRFNVFERREFSGLVQNLANKSDKIKIVFESTSREILEELNLTSYALEYNNIYLKYRGIDRMYICDIAKWN